MRAYLARDVPLAKKIDHLDVYLRVKIAISGVTVYCKKIPEI
jgi:hypothetical protein